MASILKNPPIIYRIGSSDERKSTWLELFFDLIYVAAIAQLAGRYSNGIGFGEIPGMLLLFVPVWWSWVGQAFYNTRFESEDIFHRILVLSQMFTICIMSAYLPQGLESGSTGFALCYAVIRGILVIQYCRAWKHLPHVRPVLNIYIPGFTLAIGVWVASISVPAPWKFGMWILGIAIDIATPLSAGKLQAKFPPHLTHIPERFGLFTIIVLGEAVVALSSGFTHAKISISSFIVGGFGFLLTTLIWWQYFEIAAAAESRPTIDAKGVRKFQMWLYGHLPLMFSIMSLAILCKRGINMDWLGGVPFELTFIWCLFNTFVLLSLLIIQLSNPVQHCPLYIKAKTVKRLVVITVMFLSGFLPLVFPISMISICLITFACHIMQIMAAKAKPHVSGIKMGDHPNG